MGRRDTQVMAVLVDQHQRGLRSLEHLGCGIGCGTRNDTVAIRVVALGGATRHVFELPGESLDATAQASPIVR